MIRKYEPRFESAGIEYRGLSTDPKPTDAPINSIFYELDTDKVYYMLGDGSWAQEGVEFIYGFRWDKVNAAGTRYGYAEDITTNTANFGHFGSINPNYADPFDDIYPWSERTLVNIDLDIYMALTSGSKIEDCIKAKEGEDAFSYDDPNGVWVYTPDFYGRTYEDDSYRYFEVKRSGKTASFIHYPSMITGRWLGVEEDRTIDGSSKTIFLPKKGMNASGKAMSTYHTEAKNYRGSLIDIYTIDASALLYAVEYASMNSQSKIGSGVSSLYLQSGFHPAEDATDSNTIKLSGLTSAQLTNVIPGAIVDLGTSDGGMQTKRTSITAVSTEDSVTTITLVDTVTVTTSTFVSIHGLINVEDAGIGSKSGYLGTDTKCNAYYRGEVLYANKWQYILGAYREKDTTHIWIADEPDDYDALDTSKHKDTGLVLAASSGYIKTLETYEGLSIPAFCTEAGGGAGSANPVGDYCYVPSSSTGNTVLILGGNSGDGAYAGLFHGNWNAPSSDSNWRISARPRLKHPS